jgi:hypothetical protein
MENMKRFYLSLFALIGTLVLSAQPTPTPVTNPGSKGNLPSVNEIAPARENEFVGLELYTVGYDSWIINGYYKIVANLSFPMAEELGGEYYTIQYRNGSSDEWTYFMDGDNPEKYGERIVGISPGLYGRTDYRLIMHGGPLDGYVSNVVTATPPSLKSRPLGWSESPSVVNCMVGIPIGEEFENNVSSHIDGKDYDYYTNDGYFTYQWYRRNPNNWDMEKINGATGRIYTPTSDDVGYQLVLEVGGDDEHASFTLRHPFNGVVRIPVQASIDYLGPDGFVLNTDYIIPEPRKMFTRGVAWGDDVAEFDTSCIFTRNPGQYEFRIPEEEYSYCEYVFTDPCYFLTFVYGSLGWFREAQIITDRYKGALKVKTTLGGNNVPTTIDVIGKNIDDEWVLLKSKTMNADADSVMFDQDWETEIDDRLFQGDYYIMARATSTTADTYYPSALSMETATLVNISEENMWEPKLVEINLQPATGVKSIFIDGTDIEESWSINGYKSAIKGLNIIRTSEGTIKIFSK